jgi:hypothetical protein
MLKHRVLLLATSLLAAASGCCCVDRVYRPTGCADSGWDPVLGSGHDDCGHCSGHTPCQSIHEKLTCGSGCGEVYWGEWISDPPDPCDPCDGCGNWIGPRCCPPRWWQLICCGAPGLWGWRCGPDACCDNGCDHGPESTCDGHGEIWNDADVQYYDKGVVPPPSPTQAKPEVPLPQPIPDTTNPQTRNSRLKPQPMRPVRSTQPSLQRSPHGHSRARSL